MQLSDCLRGRPSKIPIAVAKREGKQISLIDGISNHLTLTDEQILANLQKVQENHETEGFRIWPHEQVYSCFGNGCTVGGLQGGFRRRLSRKSADFIPKQTPAL